VIRLSEKRDLLIRGSEQLQDEVNKLKLDKLKGDVGLATENLIKDLENQIRENDEVIKQEQLNANLINPQYEAAKNEVEEIGLILIIKSNLSLKEK
jgi:hypothetical protein